MVVCHVLGSVKPGTLCAKLLKLDGDRATSTDGETKIGWVLSPVDLYPLYAYGSNGALVNQTTCTKTSRLMEANRLMSSES